MGVGLSSSANVDQSTDLFGSDDHRDNPDSNSAKKAFFGFISRDAVGDSGIGFEFGYVEHIETNYAAFGSGASVDIDMTSLYLAAVGTITLSKYGDDDEKKVELFGKIGLHSWDWDGTGRGTLTGKDSGDGSDWFYGVGLDFGPQDRKGFVLRLEYEVFPVDTEYTLTTSSGIIEDEIDYEAALVNVSLIWRF